MQVEKAKALVSRDRPVVALVHVDLDDRLIIVGCGEGFAAPCG
jgi:hypothetical protein